MSKTSPSLIALLTALALLAAAANAQQPFLFINEVIAENGEVGPEDLEGGTPDLIEIYNASENLVSLGTASDRTSYYLSDGATFDVERAWRFPSGLSNIPPLGRLVIFCDTANLFDPISACELHAGFSIASDGSEPITLFGPEGANGERPILDQVWLPPLRSNVSFGRYPDGAGPAPVPIEATLDVFVFNPLGSESPPSFGTCSRVGACGDGGTLPKRFCNGRTNGPGANLEPRIDRFDQSTNAPAAGEAVALSARVTDDADPLPENIAKVEIAYRAVRGLEAPGEWTTAPMAPDGNGVRDNAVRDLNGNVIGGRPLNRWSVWTGEIPGQPEGARVEFFLRVTDAEGLSSTDPRTLCPDGVGPCNREFGGPGCARDAEDVTCGAVPATGERFIECSTPFSYASGYVPRGALIDVVINEVVPLQDGLLQDLAEDDPCTIADACPQADPFCCTKREDFIELFNGGAEAVDLAGLWLSDGIFHPRGWQFPPGSRIDAGEHLIVWLDDDGAKCPDVGRLDPPCFWECPDPTDPAAKEYHTNFALAYADDQIFLFDTEENNFGLIHGAIVSLPEDPQLAVNRSLALIPDGDRSGCFQIRDDPTPRAANVADGAEPCPGSSAPRFIRGDCNGDGRVEGSVTDGVFLLSYNFTGGAAPPCLAACDANGDGRVEGGVADAVYILTFNFLAGPAPVAPYPDCGEGTRESDAGLGCGELGCRP